MKSPQMDSGANASPESTNADFRIAFVTDDAYRAETIQAVAEEADWQLVSAVGNHQPDSWVAEQVADLALIDLDINGAVALLARLAAEMPDLPLVALATPQHLVELQDALLAGAKAFVPFPVNGQQFVATITRVAHSQNGGQESTSDAQAGNRRVVAIAGLKGGVGRSTVAVNLALALKQNQTSDVILVEAHHGLSDISVMMSVHPTRSLSTLAAEEVIDADIVAGNLHAHSSGVRLLSAPTAVTDLVDLPAETWQQVLENLTALAPTVVIDTSAEPGQILSEVLTVATDIVVVTDPEMTSLNGAHGLIASLNAEGIKAQVHLVINRAEAQGGVASPAIAKRMGQPVAAELPADGPLVTYAINRGVPIVQSHAKTALGRQLFALASRFRIKDEDAQLPEMQEGESGPLSTFREKVSVIASLF